MYVAEQQHLAIFLAYFAIFSQFIKSTIFHKHKHFCCPVLFGTSKSSPLKHFNICSRNSVIFIFYLVKFIFTRSYLVFFSGQKFAMLEMKCILSKMLRKFELLPTQPAHKLQLAPEVILLSKNGVNIRLKRRKI